MGGQLKLFTNKVLPKYNGISLLGGQGLHHGKHNASKRAPKHPRIWLPNIQYKSFLSPTLNRVLRIQVTTRVNRTIAKHGGLEPYVLRAPEEELGDKGIWLRESIKKAAEMRKKLGIPVNLQLPPATESTEA